MYTDELSNEFQTIIRQLNQLDACRGHLTYVMCLRRFPACNDTTGRLTPLCLTDCPTFGNTITIDECSGSFFINNQDFPLINELVNSVSCEPESYINFPRQYIGNASNECVVFSK